MGDLLVSDLTKRQYGAQAGRLQADTDRALRSIRGDLDNLDSGGVAYVPGDPERWDPVPTTLQEAVDRMVRWMYARHGGDFPIPE